MNSIACQFTAAVFATVAISLAGCGASGTTASTPPAEKHNHEHHDHDHEGHDHEGHGDEHGHAHPESFAEALTEVVELHAKIKTAVAADDLKTADPPLHELGHLLEELPELAQKESLSEEDQQQVKQAAESLMDSYGAFDERIHGGESKGKSYDEVADQIDEAISKLKAIKLPESNQ